MCTNMFAWLLKILCQTFIAFDQNKIIYDKKKKNFCKIKIYAINKFGLLEKKDRPLNLCQG